MSTVSGTLDAFLAALIDPALPVPKGVTSARGEADRFRFAVYRNDVHVSLVEALRKTFRVTNRIVGEEFFTASARVYVAGNKPVSPVLIGYGEAFPDFLATFPPAAPLPYLPDLARLEFAWTQSYNAADAAALSLSDLASIPPDRLAGTKLAAHPASALITSSYPIGAIWAANRKEAPEPLSATGEQSMLITRPTFEVRVSIVPDADACFFQALAAGGSLEAAASACSTSDGFDFGTALTGLVKLGAFAQLGESNDR